MVVVVVVKVERLLMLTHGYMCRYDTSSGLGEKKQDFMTMTVTVMMIPVLVTMLVIVTKNDGS